MSKKDTLQKEILKTLAYSNVFSYPLSFHQIALYLGTKTNRKELGKTLRRLEKTKKITQKTGKYYLYHKKAVDWKKKLSTAKKDIRKVQGMLGVLERIPWIKLLAITGPLAASNPRKDDDIDIFIVTKSKRLWLTRLFTVAYLKILGIYRTDKDPSGKICPNLFMDERSLSWEKSKRNLYIASEIVRMQPIIDREETYLMFLNDNRWIKRYFPNFHYENLQKERKSNPGILDLAEKIAYLSQKKYMKNKITNEEILPTLIHFNKNDKSMKILNKFQKTSKKIG